MPDWMSNFIVVLYCYNQISRQSVSFVFQTSPGLMSERLIELMANIRAPVRRDWKEMRRAFRVRFLFSSHVLGLVSWVIVFLRYSLVLGVFLIVSRKKSLETSFSLPLPLWKCGLVQSSMLNYELCQHFYDLDPGQTANLTWHELIAVWVNPKRYSTTFKSDVELNSNLDRSVRRTQASNLSWNSFSRFNSSHMKFDVWPGPLHEG